MSAEAAQSRARDDSQSDGLEPKSHQSNSWIREQHLQPLTFLPFLGLRTQTSSSEVSLDSLCFLAHRFSCSMIPLLVKRRLQNLHLTLSSVIKIINYKLKDEQEPKNFRRTHSDAILLAHCGTRFWD